MNSISVNNLYLKVNVTCEYLTKQIYLIFNFFYFSEWPYVSYKKEN